MTVNGKVGSEMAMALKLGQMELSTSESGETTRLMDKESLFISMEIVMRVTGQMTKLMDLECTAIQMAQVTKANGKMTSNMVLELNHG